MALRCCYEDSLASVTLVLSAPLFYLFFANRHLFPINQREPLIALAATMIFTVDVCYWYFEQMHPELPVWSGKFTTQIGVGTMLVLFLVRVWKLFMDAGIAKERVKNQPAWFVAHRNLRSRNFLLKMATIGITFHTGLFLIALFTTPYEYWSTPSRDGDPSRVSGLMIAGLSAVYSCVYIGFSVPLANMNDGFYIKQELRAVGILAFVLLIVWLLMSILGVECEFPSCGVFVLWLCCIAMIGGSIVFPLFIAWRDPRFSVVKPLAHGRNESLPSTESTQSGQHSQQSSAEEFPDYEAPPLESVPIAPEKLPTQQSTLSLPPPPMSDRKLKRLRGVSLEMFLTHPGGKEAFRAFTVREFSVENMLFVEAVKEFRVQHAPTKEEAQRIIDQFIAQNAPNQVNLPDTVIKAVFSKFEDADLKGCFEGAYEHVMKLMSRDAFRRFQSSNEWRIHVVAFDAETRLASGSSASTSVSQINVAVPAIPTPRNTEPYNPLSSS